MAKQPAALRDHLVLQGYFLAQFGFTNFSALRAYLLETPLDSLDPLGDILARLHRHGAGRHLSGEQMQRCEGALKSYHRLLCTRRHQPDIELKYFQVLAILFSELYFDAYFRDAAALRADLNRFHERASAGAPVTPFRESDLQKLAFWMATGSGKTLLMHIHYWQLLKFAPGHWDNMLLITPNAGLSRQHAEEFQRSGIPCRVYDGNPDHLQTPADTVVILDIHKLEENKTSEGVRVDIACFEGRNLVFIDEGHKGQRSVEQRWKKLRERLAAGGMILEYSATFGQIIGKNRFLLDEYAKSILFDYAYRHFFHDGYGKAFRTYNLRTGPLAEGYSRRMLGASLLTFFAQLNAYRRHRAEVRRYQIETPLWVFVGSRVAGKKLESDILQVVRFLRELLRYPERLRELLQTQTALLNGKGGLLADSVGEELTRLTEAGLPLESIYQTLFYGKGELTLWEIRHGEGEIGLKTGGSPHYFGVINVGDVATLKKLLEAEGLTVETDHFSSSLFDQIHHIEKPLHVLIGSKKFIEGWNSWRVANMVLMNMGKGEGPQIVQLFGRGVRLKGQRFSLRREAAPAPALRLLQTLYLFGLNADYMNSFLSAIRQEGLDPEKPDRPALKPSGEGPGAPVSATASPSPLPCQRVQPNPALLSRLRVDVRPRLTMVHSEKDAGKSAALNLAGRLRAQADFLDWDQLLLSAIRFKRHSDRAHLILEREVIRSIIRDGDYTLYALPEQLEVRQFEDLDTLQQIAEQVLQAYLLAY